MVSGCVSLYKTSGNKKYKKLMDKQIKPGLDLYWDTTRQPECYQSLSGLRRTKRPLHMMNNDWVAIELLRLLCRDKEQRVLKESHRPARLHLLRVVGRTGRWNLLVRTEKGIKEHLLERTCNGSLHEALQVDQR